MLASAILVSGVVLAIFGLLSVLDYMSLRVILGESGPHIAFRIASAIHRVLAHSGAQVVELMLALLGLLLVTMSLRMLMRATGRAL